MTDELHARQGLYNLLATLFLRAPELETVALLQTEPVLAALEELLAGETGSERLLSWLRTTSSAEVAERLAIDYTMLFSVPGKNHVPPHESVYRDKLAIPIPSQPEINYVGDVRTFEGLYWGDSTVAVAGEYGVEGFEPGDAIPDSLGLELAFMAHLCAKEIAFTESGNTAAASAYAHHQRKFLTEHLLQWVPTFTARVGQSRPESLYALVAMLTLGFLENEAKELVPAS